MDDREKRILAEEIGRRTGFGEYGRGEILRILSKKNTWLYPENEITVEEGDKRNSISLRRIISNMGPYHRKESGECIYDALCKFAGYTSDELANKVVSNIDLIKIIRKSPIRYSLLLRSKTSDWSNDGDREIVTVGPILIIPGICDKDFVKIKRWENENTRDYNPLSLVELVKTFVFDSRDFA
jgi:hypothetical protein